VTDERSPEAGLWDEDEDQEDNEQTQVARNPLLVGPPASSAGAKAPASGSASVAPPSGPPATAQASAEANGEARRSLSSFGAPKTGKKSSLLERLTEAGTIDEVMAIDEVSRNSQLPRPPEERLGLDRPFADLSEVSSGVPHTVLESLVPAAPDRDEVRLAPLPEPAERRSSVPPRALTEMQPTPVARVPTIRRALEPVREITAVRDPRREPDDDFEPSRPSSERLSDADLQFVSETRDVSFVSALAQDPDVDEPPVVARFKRPPELPRNQPSIPPASLTASPDSLTPPATPIAMSAAPPPLPLPSMMVSGGMPAAPARGDSTPTERMPLPRPANHSTAPTSAPKTERPPERRSSMPWMLVAAAVLLGVGLAGLSRYRNAQSQAEPVAVAAPSAVAADLETPAPAAQAAIEAPRAEPAPVAVEKSAAEAEAKPAGEVVSPEEAAAHAARQEERERRRREREEARAAAAQAPPGEGAAAAAPAAVEAKPAAAEAKPAPASGAIPSQPTRDQVVAAMNGVLPRIQECVGDKHGQANVTITVRAAGFVSYAIVAGSFVGTPEGSCIARVVKEAQFPPFGEPFIRITYPYQL
jgi:hypothetical protein